MQNFSQHLAEDSKNFDSINLLRSDITKYINRVKKQLPDMVKKLLYLTSKYNLTTRDQLEAIRNSTKSNLKSYGKEHNIPENDLLDIYEMLKSLKSKLRMLPQYMSKAELEDVEAGRLSMDDMTIDLETKVGRNAAAKIYMPIVLKIVNQYKGKTNLDNASLLSAGELGLINAMNTWKRPGTSGDEKTTSFKTYVGYMVKNQILNDINQYGHTLSGTSSYSIKKYGSAMLDAVSIDKPKSGKDGDYDAIDKMLNLGEEDRPSEVETEKVWKSLYRLLEKNFKERDTNIFYRYFGLNGYKREKTKDIAKSFGMSDGNVRGATINKILKWMRENREARRILLDIQDSFYESLMCGLIDLDRKQIVENLLSNDMFILIEDLSRWNDPGVFEIALKFVMEELDTQSREKMKLCLDQKTSVYDMINSRPSRELICEFLSKLYPTETFRERSNIILCERMEDVLVYYKMYIINK